MIDCPEYERLERELINIRAEHRKAFVDAIKQGASDEEQHSLVERQIPLEVHALGAVLYHMTEHGCQREK